MATAAVVGGADRGRHGAGLHGLAPGALAGRTGRRDGSRAARVIPACELHAGAPLGVVPRVRAARRLRQSARSSVSRCHLRTGSMKLFGISLRKPTFNEITAATVMAVGLWVAFVGGSFALGQHLTK